MKLWEQLEDFITGEWGMSPFTVQDLAEVRGITTEQASRMIRAYLRAQRHEGSGTDCVLYRTGRTSNAVWHIGASMKDVKYIAIQTTDDVRRKVVGNLSPDLRRAAEKNPRVRRQVDAIVGSFMASIELLEASLTESAA